MTPRLNQMGGNAVIAFPRAADGTLTATGRTGTGGGLGSQGAVVVDDAGRHLYAVNAGSDSITSFRITPHGLVRVDVEPSNGDHPTSVTVDGDLLYVLTPGATTSPASGSSSGAVPFGFDFDNKGHVVVSEAAGAPGRSAPCPRTRSATGPWT